VIQGDLTVSVYVYNLSSDEKARLERVLSGADEPAPAPVPEPVAAVSTDEVPFEGFERAMDRMSSASGVSAEEPVVVLEKSSRDDSHSSQMMEELLEMSRSSDSHAAVVVGDRPAEKQEPLDIQRHETSPKPAAPSPERKAEPVKKNDPDPLFRPAPPAVESPPEAVQLQNTRDTFEKETAATDSLIMVDGPEPTVPRGASLVRLGYVVPVDLRDCVEKIQSIFIQTIESRRMPFVFHHVFSYVCGWTDKPFADSLIEACRERDVDSILFIGDEGRLQPTMDRCKSHDIPCHFLSREDARKTYWRLGLIARIVVQE